MYCLIIDIINTGLDENKNHRIAENDNVSLYAWGVAFADVKWLEIKANDEAIINKEGDCSSRKLACHCKISHKTLSIVT